MPCSTCDSFSSELEDSPPNGVDIPATDSVEDLYTRLEVLTKAYEAAEKENIRKGDFIAQLLSSGDLVEKQVDKLSEEILSLKQLLVEIKKDDQELRLNLHKALTAVSALASLPTVATSSHSNSAVSKTNGTTALNIHHQIGSSSSEGASAFAGPVSHEYEDDDEYLSDTTDDVQIHTPPQSASMSLSHDSSFEDHPYIHHFVDGATNAHEGRMVVETTNERSEQPLRYTALSETLKGFPDRFISTPSEDASPNGSKDSSRLSLSCLAQAHNDPKHVDSVEPRWNCSTFFDINSDRTEALYHHEHTAGFHSRTPDFLNHGLRFIPNENQNVYRTIMISGIPKNISLKVVLDNVRGGTIVEANILDTLTMTASITARIVFLYENSAFVYEEHTKKRPVKFNGILATVAVVPTPTWPIRPELLEDIINHRHSRCLAVRNFPRSISPSQFRRDIELSKELNIDHLLHTQIREDGTVWLEFSSIDGAGRVYAMLSSSRQYRGCKPFFTADPCCLPINSLIPFTLHDSTVENEESADTEQRSQDLPSSCPSPTTETSFSESSEGTNITDMIASMEL